MQFENKVAIVTGGTSGIGLATATQLAQAGARVVVFARDAAGLAATRERLGPNGHVVRGDVGRRDDVRRLFAESVQRYGRIDVLFANAAIVKLAPITDTSDQLLDELLATNLRGTFTTLQEAIPHLARGASVIVTTSWLDRIGFAGSSALAMTKAAIRALVRVAARELADRGVRVNALCPGAIETPLWGKVGLPADALAAAGAAITAQIPLARWGTAEEVAQAALFLASPASEYITGIELDVDGGLGQT